jgi:hypothetical protein
MKTNDVTGRFSGGEVGFGIEMGRPGVSTSFKEVEKLTTVLAGKVAFESKNPVTSLIDVKTGRFKDQSVLKERALSAIIECKTSEKGGIKILNLLRDISEEIETVFTLSVINKCKEYGIPFRETMEGNGFTPRINGKTNVGLGRIMASLTLIIDVGPGTPFKEIMLFSP